MRRARTLSFLLIASGALTASCSSGSSGASSGSNPPPPATTTDETNRDQPPGPPAGPAVPGDDSAATPVTPGPPPLVHGAPGPVTATPGAPEGPASGPTLPTTANPPSAACLAAWDQQFAGLKAGLITAYVQTSTIVSGQAAPVVRQSTWRETVKDVTPDRIAIDRSDQTLLPTAGAPASSARVITKDGYLSDCLALTGGTENAAPQVETLATRDEAIDVKAGHFANAHYVKTKETGQDDGDDYTFVSESWSAPGAPASVFAKAVKDTTTVFSGVPHAEHVIIELTELKLP